ncbi:MAG: hypothetical protein ACTSWN_17235 [Promethearchaeota archaeon]
MVIARKRGYILNSYFIIGFPNETRESIEKTRRFALSVPLQFKTFFLMKPPPGAKIFKDWAKGKELINFEWKTINYYNEVNSLSSLDPKYLEKIKRKIHQQGLLGVKFF